MSIFRKDATQEEIDDTISIIQNEGVGYWLTCYGANFDVFTPEFAAALKDSQDTLTKLERVVEE